MSMTDIQSKPQNRTVKPKGMLDSFTQRKNVTVNLAV